MGTGQEVGSYLQPESLKGEGEPAAEEVVVLGSAGLQHPGLGALTLGRAQHAAHQCQNSCSMHLLLCSQRSIIEWDTSIGRAVTMLRLCRASSRLLNLLALSLAHSVETACSIA